MQFKDPVAWADQELELQADDASRDFAKFFVEWFTAAEVHMQPGNDQSAAYAMRTALVDTESAYGFLGVEWIGQMLLLAYTHWTHGEDMEKGLTVIERRSMEVMAAMKMAELQEGAVQ